MEGIKNKNFNNNHGQRHRARDAYEVYELEHMLHTVDKVLIYYNHVKPHSLEKVHGDHFDKGRKMQHYWYPMIHDTRAIYYENIDDEAEVFTELKHEKFKLSKWKSTNDY
ncbi:hypothetical protein BUALT_Bualt17G0033500 [Buddleja alternifolia]|uniref:Uncharacterized protein n=1 Tax=Buddleja alternifolia TaxID=168488 RepID=A0AAV6W5W2_9LAMI|nr:hypothetical protein BUALT_Bualt17G0033500 [Buddleja alternifolia]